MNDEPVRRRDGAVRTHNNFGAVTLPVCPAPHCNQILNRRFELPAKSIVEEVMATEGNLSLDFRAATTLGIWLVKTWLLLVHPLARYTEREIEPDAWSLERIPDDLFTWMITDEVPPVGLSLWVTRRADEASPLVRPTRHLPLPVIVADGSTTAFQVAQMGLRFLDVTLVYHPGWPIEHPLEAERRALRLWPPSGGADLASLPQVHPRDTEWIEGPWLHVDRLAFDSATLPPLSPEFDVLGLHAAAVLGPGVVRMVTPPPLGRD